MISQTQSNATYLIPILILFCSTTSAQVGKFGCDPVGQCNNIMAWWHYEQESFNPVPKCDTYNIRSNKPGYCWDLPGTWSEDRVEYSIASNSVCNFYLSRGCDGEPELINGMTERAPSIPFLSARCANTTSCSYRGNQ